MGRRSTKPESPRQPQPFGSLARSDKGQARPRHRPKPYRLDDRIWDVFRLDEDDSPEEPLYGDFWVERDEDEGWLR